ncbi:hypothetical protein [Ramlibacter sp.]|uniref:hypothetical protein n=1 Tax=Ramlibacter sp. TaxID=1917967 RepID=UPI002FC85225
MTTPARDSTVLMIGETLLILQRFEQFVVAALLGMVSPGEADAKLEATLLRDKETLGGLIRRLGERVELPDHFAETFDRLLERRNFFVHKLFMAPWFDLRTPEGLSQVDDFMRGIRSDAKVALHVLIAANLASRAHRISPEADARIAAILERIEATVDPYFGGLSPDQYVAKVVNNALDQFAVRPKEV